MSSELIDTLNAYSRDELTKMVETLFTLFETLLVKLEDPSIYEMVKEARDHAYNAEVNSYNLYQYVTAKEQKTLDTTLQTPSGMPPIPGASLPPPPPKYPKPLEEKPTKPVSIKQALMQELLNKLKDRKVE